MADSSLLEKDMSIEEMTQHLISGYEFVKKKKSVNFSEHILIMVSGWTVHWNYFIKVQMIWNGLRGWNIMLELEIAMQEAFDL